MASRIDFIARSRTIMSQMTLKTITLRLTPETFARAAALAQLRGRSLNRLFQDGFKLLDERERDKQLLDDFTAIAASGAGETDVEFALGAQCQATAGSCRGGVRHVRTKAAQREQGREIRSAPIMPRAGTGAGIRHPAGSRGSRTGVASA